MDQINEKRMSHLNYFVQFMYLIILNCVTKTVYCHMLLKIDAKTNVAKYNEKWNRIDKRGSLFLSIIFVLFHRFLPYHYPSLPFEGP